MIHPVRYRRRPPQIEAVQVTEHNLTEIAAWCGGTVIADHHGMAVGVRLGRSIIPARPGMHVARDITAGQVGDHWPLTDPVLHWCYEPVEE